jgi:hypothetical protein
MYVLEELDKLGADSIKGVSVASKQWISKELSNKPMILYELY